MNIRYLALAFLLSAGLLAAACGDDDASPKAPDAPVIEDRGTAELTWWGQAMFTLVATDGTRIVFDPYSEIGYQVPTAEELAADVMTVSHEHPDHNNVALAGNATVLRGLADGDWAEFDETFGDTRIFSIESFHDRNSGQERGRNAIFVIETGGLRIAHLGDFGELELTADQLDDLGLADNTLVVFTSDHGHYYGHHGLIAKGPFHYDDGIKVPMIARWPGRIPAGGSSDAIAMNIDLFPTLTELSVIGPPWDRTIDGRNIFALMKGDQRSTHEYLYFFNKEILAAVRTQRWKLVVQSWYRAWNAPLGSESYHYYPGLLFDLENDPEERYSYTREHPDLAKQLRQWIDQGRRDLIEPGVAARSD